MRFSVIIPVRNRPAEIARCVAAVRGGDCELIVVDNGSTDSTAAQAAAAGARVVSEPRPNRCLARNRGAAEARGEWLLFTDSDCVPDANWIGGFARAIDGLAAQAEGSRVGALGGPIVSAPPANPVEAYIALRRWIDQEKFMSSGRRFSPPFGATANLAVRRAAFEAVGGFDPLLATAGEDADWCWRAARAGWSLGYAPDAAVVHHHRATLGGLWRQAFHYGVGNAELFAKWRGEWGARVWIEPRHYVWAAKGFLKAPVAALLGGDPLARRVAFYDGLANSALALGRIAGGARRGAIVL